jgi:hypothetical protein
MLWDVQYYLQYFAVALKASSLRRQALEGTGLYDFSDGSLQLPRWGARQMTQPSRPMAYVEFMQMYCLSILFGTQNTANPCTFALIPAL